MTAFSYVISASLACIASFLACMVTETRASAFPALLKHLDEDDHDAESANLGE